MALEAIDYLVGLDLGQASDWTAISVIERELDPFGVRWYRLRHLERPALGTPYTDVVRQVAGLMSRPQLRDKAQLVIDETGVGRPVLDMLVRELRSTARLMAIAITGGMHVSQDPDHPWRWSVPKRDLVGVLLLLAQTGRLKIARGLKLGGTFDRELHNFRVKVTLSGHDQYEAWREGDHDDIVLSVALAAWAGERGSPLSALLPGVQHGPRRESLRMVA